MVRGAQLCTGLPGTVQDCQAQAHPRRFDTLRLTPCPAAFPLQVPRGPTLPGSLETTTYQAQVLGKGSIHAELMQRQGSAGSLADQGKKKLLSTRSWSPAMTSPLKDALSRISRKVVGDKTDRQLSSGGLQSQGSDVLPTMHFLQRAAVSMRAEQMRHGGAAHGSSRLAGGAGAPLHTVVEVRGPSTDGAGVEAAAAAARKAAAAVVPERKVAAGASAAAAAADAAAGSQPLRSSTDRPSLELRATDVVMGGGSFRRRMVGQQQGDEEVGSDGDAAAGLATRPAGQLASSGLKRRSQTYG